MICTTSTKEINDDDDSHCCKPFMELNFHLDIVIILWLESVFLKDSSNLWTYNDLIRGLLYEVFILVLSLDCPTSVSITPTSATTFTCSVDNLVTAVLPSYIWTDSVLVPVVSKVFASGPFYTVPSTVSGVHTLTCAVTLYLEKVTCPTKTVSIQVPVVCEYRNLKLNTM